MEESRSPARAQRPAAQGPDPLVGRTINDRYRVLGILARGGMGKVYRAEQQPLGRLVALKVLHTNYTGDQDPEFHKRFFLEASIASKLTHPNTVTIFDYGKTDDDVYYIAMELLDGRTLYRALREEGAFPAERTMHIARQICRSLREAHGMGVIHRDLKPANVYLVQHGDEGDVVKVLDFGLVKNVDDTKDDLTKAGLFMGSPKYMSPEQIRGDRCDGRADIYALGVMMFEMLTGKAPYDRANSVHTLMAHIQEEVPSMQRFQTKTRVPPALEAVVRKCMAKAPDERYASMDEVLSALKRVSGIHNTMSGELRAVDLAEISRSVELPVQTIPGSRAELAANGLNLASSADISLAASVNGQTLVDRNLLSQPMAPANETSLQSTSTPLLRVPSLHGETGGGPARSVDNKLPFALGMVAAVLLCGGILWAMGRGESEPASPARPAAPAGAVVKAAPQPTVTPIQRSVLVSLRSTPAGAMVIVGDKEYGPTPTQVEWTGEEAELGREVTLRFVRRGYQDLTVTRQIRGPELEIDTPEMAPAAAAPVVTAPAPARPKAPPVKPAPAKQPSNAPELPVPGFRASPY